MKPFAWKIRWKMLCLGEFYSHFNCGSSRCPGFSPNGIIFLLNSNELESVIPIFRLLWNWYSQNLTPYFYCSQPCLSLRKLNEVFPVVSVRILSNFWYRCKYVFTFQSSVRIPRIKISICLWLNVCPKGINFKKHLLNHKKFISFTIGEPKNLKFASKEYNDIVQYVS